MSKHQITISSNTLFHFTNNIENVISILKYGLKPRFCFENLNFIFCNDAEITEEFKIAFPMVCFCDIPLSQAKNHMKNYGEYGIGLNKNWGIANNVSPVFYAHKSSKIIKMISKIAVKIINEFDNNNIDEKLKSDIIGSLHEMYGMIKPYKGKMKRNGSYTRILRFYDEREWRFVPREPLKYGMPENIFNNEAKREEYNHKIGEKATLRFKPSDIKYIIVSEDEQIIDIISKIEKIKKYSPDEKKLLCSRLISAKQIYEDF